MVKEASCASIDADVVRSTRLNSEWNRLRYELDTMDTRDPNYDACCAAVHQRMDEIKKEMTDVVSRSRRYLPTSKDDLTVLNHSNTNITCNRANNRNDHDDGENLPPIVDGLEDRRKKQHPDGRPVVKGGGGGDDDDDDMVLARTHIHSSPSTGGPSHTSSSSKDITPVPIQYSARRRHIVRRTYDSTSSSDFDTPHDADDVDLDIDDQPDHLDVGSLRRQLMQGADNDTPIVTVEHRAHRSHLASLRRNLRNPLRSPTALSNGPASTTANDSVPTSRSTKADHHANDSGRGGGGINGTNSQHGHVVGADVEHIGLDAIFNDDNHASDKRTRSPSPPPAAPTPPSSVLDDDDLDDSTVPMSPPVSLTLKERETLSLEQSRLERESRRIRRKPNRSKMDDTRLQDIASQLSKLSSTLAEGNMNISIHQSIPRGGGKASNSQQQHQPQGSIESSQMTSASGLNGKSSGTEPSSTAATSSSVKNGLSSTLSKGSSSNGGNGGRLKSLLSPTGRPPPLHRAAGLTYPTEKHYQQKQQGCNGQTEKSGRLGPFGKGKARVPTAPLLSSGGNEDSFNGTASSPLTDDGTEHDGEDNTSTRTKPPASPGISNIATPSAGGGGGRRKKTWQAIEAGVKAFGRSVRNTALAARFDSSSGSGGGGNGVGSAPGDSVASYSNTTTTGTMGTTSASSSSTSGKITALNGRHEQHVTQAGNGRRVSTAPRRRQSSVFADLGERLAKRDEKLHSTVDASDRMANDANDMLSAARALRQRQQKGLFS